MREPSTLWRIGDPAPPAAITPLQLGAQEPVWFGFQTPPLAELRAQAWLGRRGVEAWFPTETAWRRLARGPRRKVSCERPVVPRYVFARFTGAPQWPALRARRWLSRVGAQGLGQVEGRVGRIVVEERLIAGHRAPRHRWAGDEFQHRAADLRQDDPAGDCGLRSGAEVSCLIKDQP